ncbi:MAG: ATP-grasp domain-containing protein [Sarcina sp.]
MDINILILSAGRRVELTKIFKAAVNEFGVSNKVITADLLETAPANYFSDKYYLVSRVTSNTYIDEIIDICKKEKIKLIVPTIDTELLILAKNKQKIENETEAKVLISDEEYIKICRNKITTSEFFEKNNIGTPREVTKLILAKKDYDFPLFIKPLDGSSSINTFKVKNQKELEFFLEYIENPIVQDFMEGTEYTVDILLDFESNPITIVPRERIATRAGEISKGKIVKDREVIEAVRDLLKVFKGIGHITAQCMKTSDGIKFIEINPRFGGGAPMSIKAGANSAINIIKLLLGEKLEYNENYEEELLAIRFDDSIFINKNGELV